MRTPLDPRLNAVSLTVASPTEPRRDDPDESSPIPHVPWLLAAIAWAAAVAALGWVAVGALVSVSWLMAVHVPASDVVTVIGQGWLALHGVSVSLGGATLRLLPLGLTLLLVAGCAFAAHHAAVQCHVEAGAPPHRQVLAWGGVVGACTASYALVGGVVAAIAGSPAQVGGAVPGLLLVPFVGAAAGALVGFRFDPLAGLPSWVRRLPRALALGCAVVACGALLALVTALLAHWESVTALHDALQPDPVGAVVLTLVQVAYLPNLLAWAGSFVLGAGVNLGSGGLVAPGVAEPGLLPALPVLGAVPTVPGVADWAWLLVGLAAGGASGWWLLRGSGSAWRAGLWQGAVAGISPGLVWVVFSWFSRGDLGADLMAGFGPRFPELLLWGTLPLAVAGALYGVGRAWWLSRRAPAPEETAAIE